MEVILLHGRSEEHHDVTVVTEGFDADLQLSTSSALCH